jgi:transcriptional regulator with XRE-family HTH domain
LFQACVGEMTLALAVEDALQISAAVSHRIKPISAGAAEMIALLTRPIEGSPYAIESGRAGPGPHGPMAVNGLRNAATADPLSPPQPEFGHRIKMLRVSRGHTLKDLEERGGISATHLSEIERGKASPTVGALGRIAHALDVRPATLVEPQSLPDVTVMRAAERSRQCIQWNGATLHPLSDPIHGARLGAMLVSLPIARGPAFTHRHQGEEWITALSGLAEIRIDSEVHVLRQGDSLHFRAERPHSYSNPASAPAVLLTASRPRLSF